MMRRTSISKFMYDETEPLKIACNLKTHIFQIMQTLTQYTQLLYKKITIYANVLRIN